MNGVLLLALMVSSFPSGDQLAGLPRYDEAESRWEADWLVVPVERKATAYRDESGQRLILDNGLIRRTWKLTPNVACVSFWDHVSQLEMVRAVRPEARLSVDGQALVVGGLQGQKNKAFLTEATIETLVGDPSAFQFDGFELGEIQPRMAWKRRRHHAEDAQWPPPGISVRFDFQPPESMAGLNVRISVHYAMYDGIPAVSKWLTVHNRGDRQILIDSFVSEELALVEQTNWVEFREGVDVPRPAYLHVETDFAFGGFNSANANRHVVHWVTDPDYPTQVNWARQTPCLLKVHPTHGPAQTVPPNGSFESYRTFELSVGRADRERRSLAQRKMYRVIAPWVTENPITHHLLSNNPQQVLKAIDDAASVGFEAIILSFGSGFNMENADPEFLATWKRVADHAEDKGIELGSYSLFSSRNVGAPHMIVSPPGVQPTHGRCPAVTSEWGQAWLEKIPRFYEATGFDQFENDGPYPGDIDVTERLPLQKGEQDSRWVQWRHTVELYQRLRGDGIYINAPDFYYLNGSNKCGMGYRETNWSLPREDQPIHTRQNIFDGTWTKTPSMGWMFVPLSQYHGGGAAATIEPLDEHMDHYRRMLQSNLGLGVQAHYRGPRLFDTERVQRMVREQVDWFKKYRSILESDLIHGRRADGRRLDWMLHVNPALPERGMLCVFNPTDRPITETLPMDLYYTGLRDTAFVDKFDQSSQPMQLEQGTRLNLKTTVPAGEMVWYVIRSTGKPE